MKVFFYAGRVHHVHRLSNVVNLLHERGVEVICCTSDNAVGIDTNTAHLAGAGIPFKHALDYYSPEATAGVSKMVHHALGKFIGTPFDEDTFAFIDPFWITYSLREACEDLVGFDKMLEMEKPDKVLILHENNFFSKILAYLCYERDITCVAFQEGLLRQRDQETQNKQSTAADYVSTLFVWSEIAKQNYIAAGVPEDKLEVAGISHLDPYIKLLQENKVDKAYLKAAFGFDSSRTLISFALPQLSRYDGDVMQTIGQVSDWASSKLTSIAIRLHPFDEQGVASQIQSAIKSPLVKVITQGNLPELILASDVVMSQHSTAAVETLALNVPLAEIDLQNHGTLEPLSEKGVAVSIKNGELDKLLKPLEGVIPQVLVPWKVMNLGQLDGHATERIVEKLLL